VADTIVDRRHGASAALLLLLLLLQAPESGMHRQIAGPVTCSGCRPVELDAADDRCMPGITDIVLCALLQI
jgi:hypothetical protein